MRYLTLILLLAVFLNAQIVDPFLKTEHNKSILEKSALMNYHLLIQGEGDYAAEIEKRRFAVQTQIGKYATVIVPRARLEELMKIEGIIKIGLGPKSRLHNSLAVGYQHVDKAYAKGYKGSKVIVGIVDTGIDFYNPMFLNGDGETRILSIWDHTRTGSGPPGTDFTFGTEYTQTQINNDLSSGTPHSIVPHVDAEGHGTHVAGSAAGQDLTISPAEAYDGGAKEANMIIVKTDFNSATILSGVKYIFDKAAARGKPCVVNLSLGSLVGPHDGTDTQPIDLLTGPGKIVVRSAGNSGGDNIHYFAENVTTSDAIQFGYSGLVNLWLEAGDTLSSVSLSWTGGSISNVIYDHSKSSNGIDLHYLQDDPDNGKKAVWVAMNNSSLESQTFTLTLNGLSNGNGNGTIGRHVWAEDPVINDPYGGFSQGTLYGSGDSHYPYTLSNEACAPEVITVGAFMNRKYWNGGYSYKDGGHEGGIANFSAIGPTADGAEKPDIIAGGTIVMSARSSDATYDAAFIPESPYTNYYAYMQGTSMASPVAAGAIALLLEKHPTWTPDDVKTYLRTHARGTSRPSGVTENEVKIKTDPNNWDKIFGYGAVDLTYAFEVDAIEPVQKTLPVTFKLEQNYPNPFNPSTSIKYQVSRQGNVQLVVYNALGQRVRTLVDYRQEAGNYSLKFDAAELASGVYYYKLSMGNGFVQIKKMILMR